jgi:hypothetical protein
LVAGIDRELLQARLAPHRHMTFHDGNDEGLPGESADIYRNWRLLTLRILGNRYTVVLHGVFHPLLENELPVNLLAKLTSLAHGTF